MTVDQEALADLVAFARIEAETHDVAPWADVLSGAGFERSFTQWISTLYNTFDDYGSAFAVADRWPSLAEWADDPFGDVELADGRRFIIRRERRNLHGGRVSQRMGSYADLVGDRTEEEWLNLGVVGDTDHDRFTNLCAHMRQVWGVGRQAAFEWAEFQGKVMGAPVYAGHAFLWESEGPRRSLQRIYGEPKPTRQWLDDRAEETMELLRSHGVELAWWDFETIICDFNVMRDGRYYPGKHLAALREEIDLVPSELDRAALLDAWHDVIPAPWVDIAPGVRKDLLLAYRDTGHLLDRP